MPRRLEAIRLKILESRLKADEQKETENNKLAIVGITDRQSDRQLGRRHGCDMQPVNLANCHTHVTDV